MCRKNLVVGAALIAFGSGILVGIMLESCLLSVVISIAAIVGGFFLLRLI